MTYCIPASICIYVSLFCMRITFFLWFIHTGYQKIIYMTYVLFVVTWNLSCTFVFVNVCACLHACIRAFRSPVFLSACVSLFQHMSACISMSACVNVFTRFRVRCKVLLSLLPSVRPCIIPCLSPSSLDGLTKHDHFILNTLVPVACLMWLAPYRTDHKALPLGKVPAGSPTTPGPAPTTPGPAPTTPGPPHPQLTVPHPRAQTGWRNKH